MNSLSLGRFVALVSTWQESPIRRTVRLSQNRFYEFSWHKGVPPYRQPANTVAHETHISRCALSIVVIKCGEVHMGKRGHGTLIGRTGLGLIVLHTILRLVNCIYCLWEGILAAGSSVSAICRVSCNKTTNSYLLISKRVITAMRRLQTNRTRNHIGSLSQQNLGSDLCRAHRARNPRAIVISSKLAVQDAMRALVFIP